MSPVTSTEPGVAGRDLCTSLPWRGRASRRSGKPKVISSGERYGRYDLPRASRGDATEGMHCVCRLPPLAG